MKCANNRCFGLAVRGTALCGRCDDIKGSAIVIGVCLGLCVLIVAAVEFWSLI